MMKRCYRCKEEKPLHDFYKDSSRRGDGRKANCRTCSKKKAAGWVSANRDEQNAHNRRSAKKHAAKRRAYGQTQRRKFGQYQTGATRRHLSFELTFDQFTSFWQKPCWYCRAPVSTVGIDRVDSSKGYTLENCVSCCSTCNRAKMKLPQQQFLGMACAIQAELFRKAVLSCDLSAVPMIRKMA